MRSLWMLPLLILLALVTCARVALAEPPEEVVFCEDTDPVTVDATSGADPAYQLISYQPADRDKLMDPFADAAPSSPLATATTPDPTEDPGAFIQAVKDAAKAAKWLVLFGLFLVLLTAGAKKALEMKWAWFGTDRGKQMTALTVPLATIVAGSMIAGFYDWGVILSAAGTFAAGAIALYVAPKKLASKG